MVAARVALGARAALLARQRSLAALVLLCAVGAGMALWQAAGDAPSTDEPLYVTDGLVALLRHDLRVNPQHPPLGKTLAAVPVLAAVHSVPEGLGRVGARAYARSLLDVLDRRHEMREVMLLARLVPVLELVIVALAVCALGRRLAGPAGGLLAAALWLLDPFVIGLGHNDGIDLPGTVTASRSALLSHDGWSGAQRRAWRPSDWPAAPPSPFVTPGLCCSGWRH